jgi:hypothetical protein
VSRAPARRLRLIPGRPSVSPEPCSVAREATLGAVGENADVDDGCGALNDPGVVPEITGGEDRWARPKTGCESRGRRCITGSQARGRCWSARTYSRAPRQEATKSFLWSRAGHEGEESAL